MGIKLGIIDYGMGNLHSVQQAFKRLNQDIKTVKEAGDMKGCNALILPGVGSFDPAIKNLQSTGLIPHIDKWVQEDKPLLGICLGLQLLFESSEEGKSKGLGLIQGEVKHLPKNQNERIPHMGWSKLKKENKCPILKKNENQEWMYFVHSYSAIVSDSKNLAATVSFGEERVTAMVSKGNLIACQFHPEKSGLAGQNLLISWLDLIQQTIKMDN